VLSRSGFSNDPLFAQTFGKQRLTNRVVDFVRPGVEQVFPLEVDFGTTQPSREMLGIVQLSRPTSVVAKARRELCLKQRVRLGLAVSGFQFLEAGE